MLSNIKTPTLIEGKKFTDDRGQLSFANNLDLSAFKRFYLVENHAQNFIRAWHGHLNEYKVFFPVQGSILAACVKFGDPNNPDLTAKIDRQVLDASSPSALVVPSGYANGFMTLSKDAKLLVFSSSTVDESKNDDFRFPFDMWNPWVIEQR